MSSRVGELLETLTRKLARAVVSDTGDESSLAQDSFNLFSGITRDKTAAPARLSELLACSSVDRQRALRSDPRYQTYALAAYTLQRCEQAIGHSPGMSIELARLARLIVAQLDRRTCGGSAALADLGAYTLAMEGNAFRVSGSFQRATERFARAREIQGRGGADPDLTARVNRLESSLRRDLGQLDSALALLDRTEDLFDALRSNQQLALTIINRSNVFSVRRDFDQAMALLERAQNLSQDPYVLLCVRHNSIDILARSGRPREADQLLKQSRDLYRSHANHSIRSRKLWVESVILRETGANLDLARELMLEATNQLVDHGYDASIAGIELAALREREPQTRSAGRSLSPEKPLCL